MIKSQQFDVIVIGGGIAGISAAAGLASTLKVLVLEAESQPGYHASGRSAAYFAPAYGNAVVRSLTAASASFYQNPPKDFAPDLLIPRSSLFVADQDEASALDALWSSQPGLEFVTPEDLPEHISILKPGLFGGLLDVDGGDLRVDAILEGFRRRLLKRGGAIETRKQVVELAPEGQGWRVRCSCDASFDAAYVINAAGAWADDIAVRAGLKPLSLIPKRRTAVLIEAAAEWCHQRWPMCVGVSEHFYFKAEGHQLLISPADETPQVACDAQPEDYDIALAIDRVQAVCELGEIKVKSAWAGLRTFASDGAFVVGEDARAPGFFWFAGQGGYGFQSAPALADLITGLVTKRHLTDIEQASLPLLNPARLQVS